MISWTNAPAGDLKRLEAIRLATSAVPWLVDWLFHESKPELRLPSDRLKIEMGVFSGGEQVIARVAMDIWGCYGGTEIIELCRLDDYNFKNVVKALTIFRQGC